MALAPTLVSAVLALVLTGCHWLDDPDGLPPSAPAPVKGCPPLMQGIKCAGGDLNSAQTDDLAGCCDLCSKTTACGAFTYRADSGSCSLKSSCGNLVQDWTHGLNTTSATMPGRLQVQRGWTEIEGYRCSGQKDTVLFFPDKNGSYPVIVYGHGTWGAIDGNDEWLETVAAAGFVVIAPFSGMTKPPCHSDSARDMVHALEQAKQYGAALHPALAVADWTRSGVVGHSRGAYYAPLAAALMQSSKKHINVAAMVVSHAAMSDVPETLPVPAVPGMFTTGTEDEHDTDDHVYAFYHKYPALNKVYANLVGGTHMEPQVGQHLNKFSASFLSCHVSKNETACSKVYGKDSTDLCQAYEYKKCSAHMNGKMLQEVDASSQSLLV